MQSKESKIFLLHCCFWVRSNFDTPTSPYSYNSSVFDRLKWKYVKILQKNGRKRICVVKASGFRCFSSI